MKKSIAIAALMAFSGAAYAGSALEQLDKGNIEIKLPAPAAFEVVRNKAVSEDSMKPSSTKVYNAESVSGSISNGSGEHENTQCSVTVDEYSDRYLLILRSDATPYETAFSVAKALLPLNKGSKLREKNNNEDDIYSFIPNLFGSNGKLYSFDRRYYADSHFTPHSEADTIEVSPDLSKVISASVKLKNKFGDAGSVSCEF